MGLWIVWATGKFPTKRSLEESVRHAFAKGLRSPLPLRVRTRASGNPRPWIGKHADRGTQLRCRQRKSRTSAPTTDITKPAG